MSSLRRHSVAVIRFRLSTPTPSLNQTLRMHWSAKRLAHRMWGWQLLSCLPRARWAEIMSNGPAARARVHITRHGSRLLDEDNLIGGCKGLVDVLKPPSKSNPFGLGLIAGDEPDKLALTVAQVKCARADACTWVEIEEIS